MNHDSPLIQQTSPEISVRYSSHHFGQSSIIKNKATHSLGYYLCIIIIINNINSTYVHIHMLILFIYSNIPTCAYVIHVILHPHIFILYTCFLLYLIFYIIVLFYLVLMCVYNLCVYVCVHLPMSELTCV